jgi:hypothetical protein
MSSWGHWSTVNVDCFCWLVVHYQSVGILMCRSPPESRFVGKVNVLDATADFQELHKQHALPSLQYSWTTMCSTFLPAKKFCLPMEHLILLCGSHVMRIQRWSESMLNSWENIWMLHGRVTPRSEIHCQERVNNSALCFYLNWVGYHFPPVSLML